MAKTSLDPNAPQTAPGSRPENVTAEINALERAPSGYAVLVVTVNGGGSTAYGPSLMADLDGLYVGAGTSGVTLQAGTGASVRCGRRPSPDFTSFPGSRFHAALGGRVTVWTTHKVPQDVDEVTVQIPGFRPAAGVPVS